MSRIHYDLQESFTNTARTLGISHESVKITPNACTFVAKILNSLKRLPQISDCSKIARTDYEYIRFQLKELLKLITIQLRILKLINLWYSWSIRNSAIMAMFLPINMARRNMIKGYPKNISTKLLKSSFLLVAMETIIIHE